MIYRNLLNATQPRLDGDPLPLSFRGVAIVADGQTFHYVLEGALIATRPNHRLGDYTQAALHRATIDGLLDGKCPVSQPVFDHLTNQGHNPKSWAKADKFIARQEKDFSR